MTRGQIIQHVRDTLGDRTEGFWTNDELSRTLQLEMDRHAQEALSVPVEVTTNSIYRIHEYQLPNDYAEMIRVWYVDGNLQRRRQLIYVQKATLGNYGAIEDIGEPQSYYMFNDKLTLYPAPSRGPILSKGFDEDTGDTIQFDNIYNFTDDHPYGINLSVYLDEQDGGVELSPGLGYIAHVSLYLRRLGPPVFGVMGLEFTRDEYPIKRSGLKDMAGISYQPAWVNFDFSASPITYEDLSTDYQLKFYVDDDYVDNVDELGGGVQFAYDDDNVPFFMFHPLRNDIVIEYYRNTTRILENDEDVPEIPDRYHRTLIDMVIARSLEKDGFNLQLASYYQGRVAKGLREARGQAMQNTLGDQVATDSIQSSGDYITYSDGRLVGRGF